MNQSQRQESFLAAALWPQATPVRDVVLVLAGSWLIALTAQIEVPMWPVPVTGQTLGVLLIAALLGAQRGTAAVLAYLFQGAMGLPVFAGGAGGTAVLLGPTAGYLAGFVPAAYLVGWLCQRGWDRRGGTAVVAMLLGNAIIYLFGIGWLQQFTGWDQVLQLGLIPFIPGDVIKIIIAAVLLPVGWRVVKAHR